MTSKRQSNLELLRICCMISIVAGHVWDQTLAGSLHIQDGFNYLFITFIGNGVRLMINCFVMIGAWFLVDLNFQAKRVVNLWLEIFFYSVIIDSICLIFQIGDASLIWEIQAFFPIMGRPIWFGAEYICMLLLSPFMNRLLREQPLICKKLLFLIGLGIIVCASVFPIEHTPPVFSELVWFCFLYLFIGYIKLNHVCLIKKNAYYWQIAICTWMILWGMEVIADLSGNEWIIMIADYYHSHYENVISFVCSYCLFQAFCGWNIGVKKGINWFSNSVFAVYIIHQTMAFFPFLWNSVYHVNEFADKKWFWLYLVVLEVTLFVGCTLIDQIRRFLFEKLIYTRKSYRNMCRKIDEWMRI